MAGKKSIEHTAAVVRSYAESKATASSGNNLKATTLETCRNQAMQNMYSINEIGNRVVALLERLRGPEPLTGTGADGDTEPRGMLVVHLDQLELEAQRLGEIQSDLALLESLL